MMPFSRCFAPALRAATAALAVTLLVSSAPRAACAAVASPMDDPVPSWQQRLSAIEASLGRLHAGDAVVREGIARDLTVLRREISGWLSTFRPAVDDSTPWLADAGDAATVEDLASEIGRLRAVIGRIAAAQGSDRGAGAFYLGRVDVSVSARATFATTEMTPAGATVVDAADMRALDRTTLAGALSLAPGIAPVHIGARNESAVYVRGFDMRQVPLFVDGIPIYTPYDGYVDLDRFTTFDVAEVQVSKGFASVLYGPNALGGAVNVVSRRPAGRIEGLAALGYGSGSSPTGYVNAGSRFAPFYLQGGASFTKSDTFPLPDAFVPVKLQPAGDRLNAYRRDGKFNAKLGWTPNGTDEYAISYVGQRGKKGNPVYAGSDPSVKARFWKWPYWDKDSVYLVSNTHLGPSSYVRGRAYYDTYDNALYSYDTADYTTQLKSSSFRSLYHDDTYGASVEWGATLGVQTVRAAGHVKKDAHQDHNSGEPPKTFEGRIVSVGVEDTAVLSSRLSLVGGVSVDRQTTTRASDYQKAQTIDLLASCRASDASCGTSSGVNPQAGLFYALPTGQVRVTVARKTRMPSLKDRYSYKFGTAVPNPDLKAEHAVTVETGYQGTLGPRTSFQASAFYSRITDLIQRFYLQPNLQQMRNIGEASHAGIELDARTHLVPHLDLGANYTYLRRRNLSDLTPLVDSPRHKGRITATGTVTASVRLLADLEFEKGRLTQNEAGTYLNVPAFLVASVKGSWTIAGRVDAELSLLNAFDKYYWIADGYPEPGRTVLGTVRYRF